MEKLIVQELHPNGGTINGPFDVELPPAADYQSYHSIAVFHSSLYQKIFGKLCRNTSQSKRRSSIVKISFTNPKTCKRETIHREFDAIGVSGLKSTMIGLTFQSLKELGIDDKALKNNITVEVCKGSWLKFYWNHQNNAIRVSLRFTIWFFIISLFVSIVSLLCSIWCIYQFY